MTDIVEIERRLLTVEAGLAELRNQVVAKPTTGNWVDQIAGSLADLSEEEYQEYLACCRAVRDDDSAETKGGSPS